jgi:hypothetical protein
VDPNALLAPLLAGGNPWLIAVGALLVLAAQRFGLKFQFPPPPTPSSRPVLDLLLRLLGRGTDLAAGRLADLPTAELLKARAALDTHLTERAAQADQIRAALTPEPGKPV